jgi:hypothetical protein
MVLFKRQGFQDLDFGFDLGGMGGSTASSAYMCTHTAASHGPGSARQA